MNNFYTKKLSPKIAGFCFLLFSLSFQSFAQSTYGIDNSKQHHYASLSFGLNSFYKGLPVGIIYEYGMHNFSVGAIMDINLSKYPSNLIGSDHPWKYKAAYYGLRASYHFDRLVKSKKADLYVGIGSGYQNFVWRSDAYGKNYVYKNGISFDYYLGGKFRLKDMIYLSLEAGNIGMSNARLGLSFNLGEK